MGLPIKRAVGEITFDEVIILTCIEARVEKITLRDETLFLNIRHPRSVDIVIDDFLMSIFIHIS